MTLSFCFYCLKIIIADDCNLFGSDFETGSILPPIALSQADLIAAIRHVVYIP